jgi:hypothetical protein
MDLLNDKGTNGTFYKSCRIVDNLEDLIAWFIVAEEVAAKVAMVIVINQSLGMMAKIVVVGNIGNRQKHVLLKDKGTGRNLQGAMNCSANISALGRSKSAVYAFVSFFGNIS